MITKLLEKSLMITIGNLLPMTLIFHRRHLMAENLLIYHGMLSEKVFYANRFC